MEVDPKFELARLRDRLQIGEMTEIITGFGYKISKVLASEGVSASSTTCAKDELQRPSGTSL
jgi:hypothetical protein